MLARARAASSCAGMRPPWRPRARDRAAGRILTTELGRRSSLRGARARAPADNRRECRARAARAGTRPRRLPGGVHRRRAAAAAAAAPPPSNSSPIRKPIHARGDCNRRGGGGSAVRARWRSRRRARAALPDSRPPSPPPPMQPRRRLGSHTLHTAAVVAPERARRRAQSAAPSRSRRAASPPQQRGDDPLRPPSHAAEPRRAPAPRSCGRARGNCTAARARPSRRRRSSAAAGLRRPTVGDPPRRPTSPRLDDAAPTRAGAASARTQRARSSFALGNLCVGRRRLCRRPRAPIAAPLGAVAAAQTQAGRCSDARRACDSTGRSTDVARAWSRDCAQSVTARPPSGRGDRAPPPDRWRARCGAQRDSSPTPRRGRFGAAAATRRAQRQGRRSQRGRPARARFGAASPMAESIATEEGARPPAISRVGHRSTGVAFVIDAGQA